MFEAIKMEQEKHCSSCKVKVANDRGAVSFKCPGCNEYEIVRCTGCRSNAAKFKCPNCGFEGPN